MKGEEEKRGRRRRRREERVGTKRGEQMMGMMKMVKATMKMAMHARRRNLGGGGVVILDWIEYRVDKIARQSDGLAIDRNRNKQAISMTNELGKK